MEDNYYVPALEEFHYGFEYEMIPHTKVALVDYGKKNKAMELIECKDYKKGVYGETYVNLFGESLNTIKESIKSKTIRVKYLDREDIESFGFELVSEREGVKLWFEKKEHYGRIHSDTGYHYCHLYLEYDPKYKTLVVRADVSDGQEKEKFFEGVIKNKSELRKLFKEQLNIIEDEDY